MRVYLSLMWVSLSLLSAIALAEKSYLVPFDSRVSSTVTELKSFEQLVALQRGFDLPALVFLYDSADVNSVRAVPEVEEGAKGLKGFARVYAADIRNTELDVALDSWNVQIVPTFVGLGTRRSVRKVFDGTQLATVGGVRDVAAFPQDAPLSAASIKKFGLQLLTEDNIQKIDSNTKLQQLVDLAENPSKEAATVILVTDKSSSSPLYKGLSTKFRHRAQFFAINSKKATNAGMLLQAPTVPTLVVYDRFGLRHPYQGKLHPDDISAFFKSIWGPEETLAELTQDDADAIDRESRRLSSSLFPITTASDWNHMVVRRQSLTGIFLGSAQDRDKVETIVATFAKKNPKSSVSQFVFVDREKYPSITSFLELTKDGSTDGPALHFMSMKKSAVTRFVGSLSVEGLETFIQGSLARGVGTRAFQLTDLPRFD